MVLNFLNIFFLILDSVIAGFILINSFIKFKISVVIILFLLLFSFLSIEPVSKYLTIYFCNDDFLQSNKLTTSLILFIFKYNLTTDNLKSIECC